MQVWISQLVDRDYDCNQVSVLANEEMAVNHACKEIDHIISNILMNSFTGKYYCDDLNVIMSLITSHNIADKKRAIHSFNEVCDDNDLQMKIIVKKKDVIGPNTYRKISGHYSILNKMGCACNKCKTYFEYASPNKDNVFVCVNCSNKGS